MFFKKSCTSRSGNLYTWTNIGDPIFKLSLGNYLPLTVMNDRSLVGTISNLLRYDISIDQLITFEYIFRLLLMKASSWLLAHTKHCIVKQGGFSYIHLPLLSVKVCYGCFFKSMSVNVFQMMSLSILYLYLF